MTSDEIQSKMNDLMQRLKMAKQTDQQQRYAGRAAGMMRATDLAIKPKHIGFHARLGSDCDVV